MMVIKYAIALSEGCHRNVIKAYANCLALCAKKSLSHNYRGGRDLASKVMKKGINHEYQGQESNQCSRHLNLKSKGTLPGLGGDQDLLAILRKRKGSLPTGNLAFSTEVTSNLTGRIDHDACLSCAAALPNPLRVSMAASSRTTGSLRAGGSGRFGEVEVAVVVVGVEIDIVPFHVRSVRGELGKPVFEFVQPGWQETDVRIAAHQFRWADTA